MTLTDRTRATTCDAHNCIFLAYLDATFHACTNSPPPSNRLRPSDRKKRVCVCSLVRPRVSDDMKRPPRSASNQTRKMIAEYVRTMGWIVDQVQMVKLAKPAREIVVYNMKCLYNLQHTKHIRSFMGAPYACVEICLFCEAVVTYSCVVYILANGQEE